MPKWWDKKRKLEKRRLEAISGIAGERLQVEVMAQRPRKSDDVLDNTLLEMVLERLTGIEESAKQATHADDLDDFGDDAETQGQFRGYLCPREEIWVEGCLAIALMEEWSVPKTVITNLHNLVDKPLRSATGGPGGSPQRSAG